MEASTHTLLHFLRDGPFYIDKITASTGRKWGIPVWKGSGGLLQTHYPVMDTIIKADFVTTQANLCLAWADFDRGL
jgi:hypothetical protein